MVVKIDMDMPESCENCLIKGLEDICPLVDFEYVGGYVVIRHEKCPLKEIDESKISKKDMGMRGNYGRVKTVSVLRV